MSERVYCYSCRAYHLAHEVIQMHTGRSKRWRCLKSLGYMKSSQAERDAFGKSVTESNRARKARDGFKPLPRPVLELMNGGLAHYSRLA